MNELPSEYFKVIAEQLVFIGVFLGGVSATILGTLITHKDERRIFKVMILGLAISAVSFIVAVLAMIKIQMILNPDSPYDSTETFLFYPRLVGGLAFYIGVLNLLSVIGLLGWLKSKRMGVLTSIIAVISILFVFTLT